MRPPSSIDRRAALARIAAAVAVAACGAPTDAPGPFPRPETPSRDGRLAARVRTPSSSAAPGLRALGLATGRDGKLYVPPSYRASVPAPLVLLLHGAGGDADSMLDSIVEHADAHGIVLLAVDSRGRSWDLLDGDGFGVDVAFVDRALARTFGRVAVDAARVGVAGFSDGASYALALGRVNGDLFGRVAAFSPGGLFAGGTPVGLPGVFITHGLQDPYFPVDRTSRVIAERLRDAGHAVSLREFDGGHSMWPDLLGEAAAWFGAAR